MTFSRRHILMAAGLALLPTSRLRAGSLRVISLGGDVTEIVYALGAGGLLVGRDQTSTWPEAALALPDVGYFRNLSAEGILSLAPDLILATAGSGPQTVVRQIESAGVRVVRMPQAHTPQALLQKVAIAGEALGLRAEAEALAASLRRRLDEVLANVARFSDKPRAMFLMNGVGGAAQAAGIETAADAMLGLAGAQNVFTSYSGYKPISFEAAAAAAPEAIVMMEHSLAAVGGEDKLANHPALRLTPAVRQRRIIAREGQYLLGFGPRLPLAIEDLASALRGKAG